MQWLMHWLKLQWLTSPVSESVTNVFWPKRGTAPLSYRITTRVRVQTGLFRTPLDETAHNKYRIVSYVQRFTAEGLFQSMIHDATAKQRHDTVSMEVDPLEHTWKLHTAEPDGLSTAEPRGYRRIASESVRTRCTYIPLDKAKTPGIRQRRSLDQPVSIVHRHLNEARSLCIVFRQRLDNQSERTRFLGICDPCQVLRHPSLNRRNLRRFLLERVTATE